MDTNSDLYATVGDKVGDKPQGQSRKFLFAVIICARVDFGIDSYFHLDTSLPCAAPSNVKKQISVSQHSSISQADDCSSPYARVRSHAYDKVRPAEHPYAQVKSINDNGNRPSTSAAATANSNLNAENNNPNDSDPISRRSSRESLLDSVDGRQHQVSIHNLIFISKFSNFSKLKLCRFRLTAGDSGCISNRRQSAG